MVSGFLLVFLVVLAATLSGAAPSLEWALAFLAGFDCISDGTELRLEKCEDWALGCGFAVNCDSEDPAVLLNFVAGRLPSRVPSLSPSA